MESNGWVPDLRFGIAVQDGWVDWARDLSSYPELGTVELPFNAWVLSASLPGDICLRLGEAFVAPAWGEGNARAEAVYRAALKGLKIGQKPQPSAFLLEFPADITHSTAARRHLDRVVKDLEGLPLAVAFHGADWYSARVIEGLKARGAALCLLDMARQPGSPPSIDIVTSSLVYIKLRHDTDPSAWLGRIEALASQAETLRVIFSCSDARAVRGALEKATLLARLWLARAGGG